MPKLKFDREYRLPHLPNFIQVGFRDSGTANMVDVAELTEDQLLEVAREWGVQLIKHAENRRIARRVRNLSE